VFVAEFVVRIARHKETDREYLGARRSRGGDGRRNTGETTEAQDETAKVVTRSGKAAFFLTLTISFHILFPRNILL
jgi:hypothetical protein